MGVTKARRVQEQEKVHNFVAPNTEIPQRILGFSGKIGAGKTSHANFIHALAFTHLLKKTPFAEVNQQGKLIVQDRDNQMMEVDLADRRPAAVSWFIQDGVWPFIRLFSCAEPLKKICLDMFDLPYESVYGTQEEKTKPTHLRWENMPMPVFDLKDGTVQVGGITDKQFEDHHIWSEWVYGVDIEDGKIRTGPMSGRDVMEFFGSDIMRKMYNNCYANAIAKLIKTPDPYYGLSAYAIVDDIRFPNEVEAIENIGGTVIRLTKVTPEAVANQHISNTALDNYDFKHILNNNDLTMEESFGQLMGILMELNWFEAVN